VGAFFAERTRDELVRECAERRIMLFPVATEHDIYTHPQLEARGYFTPIEHPELGATVTYPGLFIKDEEGERVGLRRRPPRIGEHNREVYQGELGLSPDALATLTQGKVI
jgi:crotonobetainyl-CoA:carnitine CoA-transferase CaiB-like acyl-CoA transferase